MIITLLILIIILALYYLIYCQHIRQKRHEALTMAIVNVLKIAMTPQREVLPSDDRYN